MDKESCLLGVRRGEEEGGDHSFIVQDPHQEKKTINYQPTLPTYAAGIEWFGGSFQSMLGD